MKYHLTDYAHATGRHCGSGSLVNLCRYEGHPLSEPMVIGLGAALGFGYYSGPGFSPTRVFFPRSSSLEPDFCAHAGIGFHAHLSQDKEKAWQEARTHVSNGHPVMINSDIFDLHYFRSTTHFNGHKTLLVGFDDENKTAVISDTEFDTEQTEPLESLAKARASRFPPMVGGGSPWFTFEFPQKLKPLPAAIRAAIRLQASRMLEQGSPMGVAGMATAAKAIPGWKDAEDWKWCARFAYQIIERRGTGGGAFRKMYAEFLAESRTQVPEIAESGMDADMANIAALWTRLADEMKAISDKETCPGFEHTAPLMAELAELEKTCFQKALQVVKQS